MIIEGYGCGIGGTNVAASKGFSSVTAFPDSGFATAELWLGLLQSTQTPGAPCVCDIIIGADRAMKTGMKRWSGPCVKDSPVLIDKRLLWLPNSTNGQVEDTTTN